MAAGFGTFGGDAAVCRSMLLHIYEVGARRSKWEQTLSMLFARQSFGLDPDVISYNSAITSYEKCEQWERALNMLLAMWSYTLEPDGISYSVAISACERGEQWCGPWEFWR
jgi:pentatricopeptide repeat protein